jgi:hypothetical protein
LLCSIAVIGVGGPLSIENATGMVIHQVRVRGPQVRVHVPQVRVRVLRAPQVHVRVPRVRATTLRFRITTPHPGVSTRRGSGNVGGLRPTTHVYVGKGGGLPGRTAIKPTLQSLKGHLSPMSNPAPGGACSEANWTCGSGSGGGGRPPAPSPIIPAQTYPYPTQNPAPAPRPSVPNNGPTLADFMRWWLQLQGRLDAPSAPDQDIGPTKSREGVGNASTAGPQVGTPAPSGGSGGFAIGGCGADYEACITVGRPGGPTVGTPHGDSAQAPEPLPPELQQLLSDAEKAARNKPWWPNPKDNRQEWTRPSGPCITCGTTIRLRVNRFGEIEGVVDNPAGDLPDINDPTDPTGPAIPRLPRPPEISRIQFPQPWQIP